MRAEIYSHFHPDEHPFMDKVSEWIEKAAVNHQQKVTDFLDPRQLYIVKSLANAYPEVQIWCSGGYDDAERQRALIAPEYVYVDQIEDELKLQVIECTSTDNRFSSLVHGDFLGAMLGLGIKRDKTGDLHISEDTCHLIVASEIADFISLNLNQVHRVSVFTELVSIDALQVTSEQWEEGFTTVPSQRLDAVLSHLIHLSRAKVLQPIRSGHCKVNWKVEEDPSRALEEGDVLSIRGYGRYMLMSFEGKTKKGNIRIKFGKRV